MSKLVTVTLESLLSNYGLPNQPISLIEPHRNPFGGWRIKFLYDDFEPLSMDAKQAAQLATSLREIGESELAGEVDEAVGRAAHYETM